MFIETTETIECPCCHEEYETTGVWDCGVFDPDPYACTRCGWRPDEPDPPPYCTACGETGHEEEGCEEEER